MSPIIALYLLYFNHIKQTRWRSLYCWRSKAIEKKRERDKVKFVTNKNENHNNYQFIYKCLNSIYSFFLEIKQLMKAYPKHTRCKSHSVLLTLAQRILGLIHNEHIIDLTDNAETVVSTRQQQQNHNKAMAMFAATTTKPNHKRMKHNKSMRNWNNSKQMENRLFVFISSNYRGNGCAWAHPIVKMMYWHLLQFQLVFAHIHIYIYIFEAFDIRQHTNFKTIKFQRSVLHLIGKFLFS